MQTKRFTTKYFAIRLSAVAVVLIGAITAASLTTTQPNVDELPTQALQSLRVLSSVKMDEIVRDSYTVTQGPPRPTAPADPAGAQAIAASMMPAYGWDGNQFNCLVALWGKESGWRANAWNPNSGAGGIPQALPASKMASAGADWQTNPATQIKWGLGYISGRYGSPCAAWEHSQAKNWY